MKFLDINDREIELGMRIAWISHNRRSTYDPENQKYIYTDEVEVKEGTLYKICQTKKEHYWGPKKGQTYITTVFGIEPKKSKYGYQRIACYKSGRLGVLTGNYAEDSQTLEKLSHLDDKAKE